jgi:hypothetical protein
MSLLVMDAKDRKDATGFVCAVDAVKIEHYVASCFVGANNNQLFRDCSSYRKAMKIYHSNPDAFPTELNTWLRAAKGAKEHEDAIKRWK